MTKEREMQGASGGVGSGRYTNPSSTVRVGKAENGSKVQSC